MANRGTIPPGQIGTRLGTWIRSDRCWINMQDGEALIMHRFAIFRLPASALPAFLRPAGDGWYDYSSYDGGVLRELVEAKQILWLASHWRVALAARVVATCMPTEDMDRPAPGLRYRRMESSDGFSRWADAGLLGVLAPTAQRLAAYRFELIEPLHCFRVFAPPDTMPVAIISERIKEEAR